MEVKDTKNKLTEMSCKQRTQQLLLAAGLQDQLLSLSGENLATNF